jgi:hypothetical protein
VPADFLQQSAIIIVAFGYVLGGANSLKLNAEAVYKRSPGWIYKLILVAALITTLIIGITEGPGFLDDGKRSRWIYDQIYSPMSATMFSMLAFYIASAAFRAFRIRTVEAGLLAVAALIVMLGRVPIGALATSWLPTSLQLPTLQDWIMEIPQNAAKRAIIIGAALGVMATGLRVILGIERAYLSGED